MKKRNTLADRRLFDLHTNGATTDLRNQVRFDGLRFWSFELRLFLDLRQPKTELVREEMASTPGSVAFYERRRSEVLQTTARRTQLLSASFGRGEHRKRVAYPKRLPFASY